MQVIKRPLGLYKANCYVLKQDGYAIIIDPGFHSQHIIEMVGDSVPLAAYLHEGDYELLQLIRRRPSVYKRKMFTSCKPLTEGLLQIGLFRIRVYHTPGHSAGSVCLEIENHLFTGDTLFKQNVGNSDNYNGDAASLQHSLHRILELEDSLIVEPGHKDCTILKDEKDFIINFLK